MQVDNEIYAIVKRSNTRLAIFILIGVIIIAICTNLFLWPFWVAQFREPISMRNDVLLSLPANTTLYNSSVSGMDMFDTGYEEYTYDQDSGRRISTDAHYGLLQINTEQFLLVRTKDTIDETVKSYTGTIKAISSDIQSNVVDAFAKELAAENITGVIIMPIMLDTIPDNTLWYVGTVVLAIISLATIWGIYTFMRRGNPLNHPILKKLSRYGDVEAIADAIDKDRAMGEELVGKLYLTRNWAFTKSNMSFNAISLRDTVWAYKQITQHRTNGIPTRKTYALHIYDKYGELTTITSNEREVTDMLQALMNHAPWMIAGHTDDIRKVWNTNRAGFIAEVEERRTQLSQSR